MNRMKSTLTERHFVVVLFVLVLITFSFAHRDSKRLDKLYTVTFQKKATVASVQPAVPEDKATLK
jgi:hypothetical protein